MTKVTRLNPKTEGMEAIFREISEEQEAMQQVEVESKSGKKQTYKLVCEQTLWRIIPDRGSLPEDLKGRWTSPTMAEKAITIYINKRDNVKANAAQASHSG